MNSPDPSFGTGPLATLRTAYAGLRLLSLDVVVGAIGSGLFVAALCCFPLDGWYFLILGLAVWLIYTLDHLLDAQRLGENASTPRHRFHHRHFRLIAIIWAALALVCGGLALWRLPASALYFGLVMGGFTLIHLALVKFVGDRTSPFLIKEGGVAMVYCGGVWGLPALESQCLSSTLLFLLIGQFFLLALINLLEFSYFELATDEQDKQTSFVRAIGPAWTRTFIGVLLAGVLVLMVLTFIQVGDFEAALRLELVFALMWAVLAGLWAFPVWFRRYERYRTYGDGAFLLPFLYFILPF